MSTLDLPPEAFSNQFPKSMGRPANTALVANGITSFELVAEHSESELLALHGVGPKAIRILKEELNKQNLAFRA